MHKAERHALYTSLVLPAMAAVVLAEAPLPVAFTVLGSSVLALLWLVWVVLNDTGSMPTDLAYGHEWDYLDRPDLMERQPPNNAPGPTGGHGR